MVLMLDKRPRRVDKAAAQTNKINQRFRRPLGRRTPVARDQSGLAGGRQSRRQIQHIAVGQVQAWTCFTVGPKSHEAHGYESRPANAAAPLGTACRTAGTERPRAAPAATRNATQPSLI